jgi:hypothetical protein
MLISAQFRGAISGVVARATTPNKCVSGTGVEGLARLSPLPKPCATALELTFNLPLPEGQTPGCHKNGQR